MSLLDLPIERIEGGWSYARTAEGAGALTIRDLQGGLYGGNLSGEAELRFAADGVAYRLSTAMLGVQIAPWFAQTSRSSPDSSESEHEPSDMAGLADGHLYLSGILGDPASRRGGGRFEIREGKLYKLPFFLAILQVLSLSVPQEDAFDRASASFFITGNRVRLRDVVLRGPALTLVGQGRMTLPDRAIDLDLVNTGPRRWSHVPLLAEVVEGTSSRLVDLHVTGPIDRPRVRARPLGGVGRELKRLFRKRPERSLTSKGSR
ncbi:MAG: hypothetical protein D6788_08715 [Planctomycetota bacterium]|nr:MAG: hypothetical protein D6788_08715 [Planctomycetota bacterium]